MPRSTLLVQVDDHVAEPGHALEAFGERSIDDSRLGEQPEHVAARLRLAEPIVGDDVGSHVEQRLNRELERVLDEALFAHVVRDALGPRESPGCWTQDYHERDLLGDELGIGHRRRSAAAKALCGDG